MIVDAPWYVTNTVIRRDLQTQQLKKKSAATALNAVIASAHTKWPNSKPLWATRQQAIAKTPANLSAYQIPSVIVVFVILVFKI
jgi:inorganic triphosphatase YgiF